jgi:hypothetical protein
MLLVEPLLDRAPPVHLVERAAHGAGDPVGVQDGLAVQVPGGAADGLHQAPIGPQKPFLVRVEDRHQGDLGQVEPFP